MTNSTVRFVICPALGLALATLAGAGRALAQDPPAEGSTPPAEGTPPSEGTQPSASALARSNVNTDVTLKQGGIGIDGDVIMNLSSSLVAKPVQIVPNLYYGVSDALTVGIVHNPFAEIFQTTGQGLCITGSNNGCPKVYDNVSLDALFSFMRSSVMDIAAHGGFDFTSFDPFTMSLRAGVKGKMLAGPLVIVFDPALNIGLNQRSGGNKEFLSLPARVGYLVMPQLDVGASIGLFGLLDGFGDTYILPLGLGATYALNSQFAVRGQFAFSDLAGHLAAGALDARAISVGAVYRM